MTKLNQETLDSLQRFLLPYRKSDGTLKHGAISDAAARFKVSKYIIRSWLEEADKTQSGVWISEAEHQTLIDAYNQLDQVEKSIEHAKKELGSCLILNYGKIRTRMELLGESGEDALKRELIKALTDEEKGIESVVQLLLTDSVKDIRTVSMNLNHIRVLKPEPTLKHPST
jgi:hypothetical protein